MADVIGVAIPAVITVETGLRMANRILEKRSRNLITRLYLK